ncbi:MAG: Wzt carbohydrate-binding domain-containing protein, partial [Geminicoccaceae bacterium]
FAVAIHVDPDILVIDEALAVGDEAFRRKCYARLDKIKASGTTIMFVSHSASAILELCDRAVLLHRGERLLTGRPRDVMSHYQKLIYAAPEHHPEILQAIRALDRTPPGTPTAPFPGQHSNPDSRDFFDPNVRSQSIERYPPRGCEIGDVTILDRNGREVNKLVPGGRYLYRYDVTFTEDAENVRFVMLLKTTTGVELGGQWSAPRDEGITHVAAGSRLRVRLPFSLPFNAGTYFGNAGVHGVVGGESVVMHRLVDAILFRVQPEGKGCADRYVNITDDPAEIETLEETSTDMADGRLSA